MWAVTEIQGSIFTLVKKVDGDDKDERKVEAVDILQDWKVTKARVRKYMPGYSANDSCCPTASVGWKLEVAKGIGHMALFGTSCKLKDEAVIRDIAVLINPLSLRALRDFKIGEVRLVASSQKIDRSGKSKAAGVLPMGEVTLEGETIALEVSPHFAAPLASSGEPNKNAWTALFWAIPEPEKNDKSNMAIFHEVEEVHGHHLRVPVMINTTTLAKGDFLFCIKFDANKHRLLESSEKAIADVGKSGYAAAKRLLTKTDNKAATKKKRV